MSSIGIEGIGSGVAVVRIPLHSNCFWQFLSNSIARYCCSSFLFQQAGVSILDQWRRVKIHSSTLKHLLVVFQSSSQKQHYLAPLYFIVSVRFREVEAVTSRAVLISFFATVISSPCVQFSQEILLCILLGMVVLFPVRQQDNPFAACHWSSRHGALMGDMLLTPSSLVLGFFGDFFSSSIIESFQFTKGTANRSASFRFGQHFCLFCCCIDWIAYNRNPCKPISFYIQRFCTSVPPSCV